MATRIYHWKHGWIPLDHQAALSKAKGSHKGARRALANAHLAGHAHHSVVEGNRSNGTHVRGLQPVAHEHLRRESHIVAAFNPHSRDFHVLDQRGARIGLTQEHDGKAIAAVIPEHVAERLNAKGLHIQAVKHVGGHDRLLVSNHKGELTLIRADGVDLNMIEPPQHAPKTHAPTPTVPHEPGVLGAYGGHPESHTVTMRPSVNPGRPDVATIRPVDSRFRGGDIINGKLGQHIVDKKHRVIDYARRVVTTVDEKGVVRRFKADGSNIDKPVMAKAPKFVRKDIGDWVHTEPQAALPQDGSHGGAIKASKVKRAYVKGNKRIIIEHKMTDAQTETFLGEVEKVLAATHGSTGHLDLTIHVPSGDRHLRNAYGYVWMGETSRVHLSPSVADGTAQPALWNGGYKMPALAEPGMTQARYTLTHELGHIVDNDNRHTFQSPSIYSNSFSDKVEERRFHNEQRSALSGYGATKVVEGYAEAFAQHHLRPGTHDAATAYARRYGWK